MAIPLRTDVIKGLISRRYGSIDDLVVEWEERVLSGQQRKGRARNRGTIYRWLDEGLPSRKDDLLGFAAALDVDPITLLRIDDEFIRRFYGNERRLFQLGALSRSRLSAFWALYFPGKCWPDPALARLFYGRDWTTRDYTHSAAILTNAYASFALMARNEEDPAAPRAVHFAYRRTSARDGMWRPYGTVIRIGRHLVLVSESGDLQERTLPEDAPSFTVETFFGPGAAEFRLASLHPFELMVIVPSPEVDCLRFGA